MKKKLLLCVFLAIICMYAFTEDIVLERNVNTQDNPYFNESGTVSIYLHEYTNSDGKRFGFAYRIDLNGIKFTNLESLRNNPLVYYIDKEKSSFYIGRIYNIRKNKQNFLDFCIDDGYNVYFMYVYAVAVSSHLNNSDSSINNTLVIKEPSEVIPIRLLYFDGYREYKKNPSRVCIDNDTLSILAFRDIGTDILESLKRNGISLSDDGIVELKRNDDECILCSEMFQIGPCPHAQHEKDYLLIDYEDVVLQKNTN